MARLRTVLFALLLTSTVAACASRGPVSPGVGSQSAVAAGPRAPSGPIDFGPYQRGGADAVLRRFSAEVTERYQPGLPLATAVSDLQGQQFKCSPGAAGRGDPPTRICRRQVTEGECTHTWQTHVWADAAGAQLSRVRGLYDKRCAADDGLLGGPG